MTFDASYNVNGEKFNYVFPLEGKLKLVYSVQYSGVLSATLSMNGDCKREIPVGDDYVIPVTMTHSEKFALNRKYNGINEGYRSPMGRCFVSDKCRNDAPIFIASLPEKGRLSLKANWTGTPYYEEFNTSGFGPINDLPTAAAFSPCGKSAIAAFGSKVFISSNSGNSFRPLGWPNPPIVRVGFSCADPPSAIVRCDDGTCYRIEVGDKMSAPSKINHPENKMIVDVIESPTFDGCYLYDGNDLFRCPWGTKPTKVQLPIVKPITCMSIVDDFITFIAEDIYVMEKESVKKLTDGGLPSNIVNYMLHDACGLFLTDKAELLKLDYKTMTLTKLRDGVNSFSVGYNTLFVAIEEGIELEPLQ